MPNLRSRRSTRIALVALFLALAAPVAADDHKSQEAGHPLRIAAYVLHPVGLAIDYLVFRPAHWFVHTAHLEGLFGHED